MSVEERHRRERSARRKAILSAAARVFARRGLEHSTIGMIAREAEVAVGTIYLYFSSRDDLFLSLSADRIRQLNERYREIQGRKLDALVELREVVSAYFDHLRESRELLLTQQSVGYAQLRKRLKRRGETERFDLVMKLGREAFDLWVKSVSRVYGTALGAESEQSATTAAVIWAGLNGAFMLTGQENVFQEFTGLDPEHFLEHAVDFQLKGAEPSGPIRARSGANGAGGISHNGNGVNGVKVAASKGRGRSKNRDNSGDKASTTPLLQT